MTESFGTTKLVPIKDDNSVAAGILQHVYQALIAKGYVVKDGKKASAVNQITVAGNFYQLLQNIRAFGDDLTFPNGGIGSPSADVGEISVAGK